MPLAVKVKMRAVRKEIDRTLSGFLCCRPEREELLVMVREAIALIAPPKGEIEGEAKPNDDTPLQWHQMQESMQAVLTVLSEATERLNGAEVAEKTGYKETTLRHHFGSLQRWEYIDHSRKKGGYQITSKGKCIVPFCESV